MRTHLQDHPMLYVAGDFDGHLTETVWYVQGNSQPQPDPAYTCNAEETDTKIWLHVKQCTHRLILLLCPDTDVYFHLNITNISLYRPMNCKVHFLDMSATYQSISNRPDLATIDTTILPQVMQALLVCTWCDYTSFFSQIGKANF